jgi:uncharacterized protein YjbI with pentapeptide repeats
MSAWVVIGVALIIFAVAVVPGMFLWWPSRGERVSQSDLGVALVAGAIVAFAVLGLQALVEQRAQELATEREVLAQHRNLELQLALSDDLTGIRLDGETLREIQLFGKKLVGASLVDANLAGSTLNRADLTEANLQRVNLTGAFMANVKLRRANLTGAKLPTAILRGAIADHATFYRADLRGADLVEADLGFAQLSGANLRGADLSSANLANADLTGANLRQAAYDEQTRFTLAWYDQRTIWPSGMTPPACKTNRPGCRMRAEAGGTS